MTFMRRKISNTLLIVGFSFLTTYATIGRAANPACPIDGAGAVSGAAAFPARVSACGIAPDTQRITLRRVVLCKGAPTPPSTSQAFSGSNCSNTIFSGAAGKTVTIQTGSTNAVSAPVNTVIPAAGTYTHAVIQMDPKIILQAQSDFDASVTSTDTTSGVKCWTKTSTMFTGTAGTPNTTSCGAAVTTLGEMTVNVNLLGGAGGTQETFTGSQGQTITAFLVDAAGKLVTGTVNDGFGDVARIVAIIENPSPMVIVKQSYKPRHRIQLFWSNSTAALADMVGFSPQFFYRSGVFDAFFEYKCGGHPNCP